MTKSHECAATGCGQIISARLLMCARHWRMVPRGVKNAVWKYYIEGQESDFSKISGEYMRAYYAAIDAVTEREAAND